MIAWRTRLRSPGLVSIVLGLLFVAAVIVLAPAPSEPATGSGPVEAFHARIVGLLGEQRPDPAQPEGGFLPDARVELLDGPDSGQQLDAYLQAPGSSQFIANYAIGDEVVVTRTVTPDGPPFVAVVDRWRLPQLTFLVALLVVAAIATAGWRGLRAILSLALSVAVVVRVLIPGLLAGFSPVPLAIGLSLALTIVAIAWTEGLTRASFAAILGTATALGLTAILGAVSVVIAGFTNAAGTDLVYFQTAGGAGLDLRGLLLAAFVMGALGILIDVTVTQAAAVAELHERAGLTGRALFASGSAVGRSHIGASINTLFLAYAGASLPALIVLAASAQPTTLILNSEVTASELVRTIAGSVGLLAAVPLTTAIATVLVGGSPREPASRAPIAGPRGWLRSVGLGAAAAVVLVIALIAGTMIGTPPHAPLGAPDVLVPPPTGAAAGPSAEAGQPAETSPSDDSSGATPPLYAVGEPVSLAELGGQPATITVVAVNATGTVGTAHRIEVELEFTSSVALDVTPDDWRLLTDQGAEYPGIPDRSRDHPLSATTLTPGLSLSGWLEFSVLPSDGSGFLEFLGSSGAPVFLVSVF